MLKNTQSKADVICYLNDNMAFGGMIQLEKQGIHCPDQIGIVGYNGLNINTVLPKRITTTITPRTEMGEVAARLLVAKILGASTDKAIALPVKIDKGQTTRYIRQRLFETIASGIILFEYWASNPTCLFSSKYHVFHQAFWRWLRLARLPLREIVLVVVRSPNDQQQRA